MYVYVYLLCCDLFKWQILMSVLTCHVMTMPTVTTHLVASSAPAVLDTLEMELHAEVCMIHMHHIISNNVILSIAYLSYCVFFLYIYIFFIYIYIYLYIYIYIYIYIYVLPRVYNK